MVPVWRSPSGGYVWLTACGILMGREEQQLFYGYEIKDLIWSHDNNTMKNNYTYSMINDQCIQITFLWLFLYFEYEKTQVF